eukprot:2147133-Rhodomonas_salina.2
MLPSSLARHSVRLVRGPPRNHDRITLLMLIAPQTSRASHHTLDAHRTTLGAAQPSCCASASTSARSQQRSASLNPSPPSPCSLTSAKCA